MTVKFPFPFFFSVFLQHLQSFPCNFLGIIFRRRSFSGRSSPVANSIFPMFGESFTENCSPIKIFLKYGDKFWVLIRKNIWGHSDQFQSFLKLLLKFKFGEITLKILLKPSSSSPILRSPQTHPQIRIEE